VKAQTYWNFTKYLCLCKIVCWYWRQGSNWPKINIFVWTNCWII